MSTSKGLKLLCRVSTKSRNPNTSSQYWLFWCLKISGGVGGVNSPRRPRPQLGTFPVTSIFLEIEEPTSKSEMLFSFLENQTASGEVSAQPVDYLITQEYIEKINFFGLKMTF